MTDKLIIDGSHGEGGGQILRSTLSLSASAGRPVGIEKIRANRKKPGLAAQHLTSVRAAAMLCDAELKGAELGSQTLQFIPRKPVRAGDYFLDVAQAREGGSAGSVMLVLQTLLLPLALAAGDSTVILRGGTHVDMSPSYDYVHDVWLPMLARMGVRAELSLVRSGWYPVGRGEVRLQIAGSAELCPLRLEQRGPLRAVTGRALAANLPSPICERMASAHVISGTGRNRGRHRGNRVETILPGAGLYSTTALENSLARFMPKGNAESPPNIADLTTLSEPLSIRRGPGTASGRSLILPAALCRGDPSSASNAISPQPRYQRLGG